MSIYLKNYINTLKRDEDALFDGIEGDGVISHGWERFRELFKFHSILNFFMSLVCFQRNIIMKNIRNLLFFILRPLVRKAKL